MRASHDAFVGLFERIEKFVKPLGDYAQISLTTEMAEVFVKITAEMLSILSIATREVTRWRASESLLWCMLTLFRSNNRSEIYFSGLSGRTDIEDALNTLGSLIEEQIRMASTQVMKASSENKEGAQLQTMNQAPMSRSC